MSERKTHQVAQHGHAQKGRRRDRLLLRSLCRHWRQRARQLAQAQVDRDASVRQRLGPPSLLVFAFEADGAALALQTHELRALGQPWRLDGLDGLLFGLAGAEPEGLRQR
jgi:hypothetical protein